MKYHILGSSDLKVSDVCLGTMTWGEQNTEQEAHAQLNLATEAGVTFIDAAEMYPVPGRAETSGLTEAYLGSWLKNQSRSKYVVATKVIGKSAMNWIRGGGGLDRANIRAAVEGSLRRLQTDYIDLYQLHWPDRYVPKFGGFHFEPASYKPGAAILETMETLSGLIKEGKIRHYGLSNETPYGVSQFIKLAEKHDLPKPVSIQNAYNLLNRVYEIHLLESCFHENIELMAYSVLAFGYLTGKYRGGARPEGARITQYPNFGQRYFNKTNAAEAIEAYAQLAGDGNLANMALQFVRDRPFPKSVICGAVKLEHLESNLKALEEPMADHLGAGIEDIFRQFPNPCP